MSGSALEKPGYPPHLGLSIMTSAEIRQSFLDFFHEKQHTIVPSSSLRPDAPNLLFTNAGMNQFVPFFLGERQPDVTKWAGARPAADRRATDTQKCIRAGGKHNDLDDVGLDTYHQTFFEMLGNWSFGDYFKAEAIQWAWELLVGRWGFPPSRLYATVYQPDQGDPAERDQEAWDLWAAHFQAAGLDPSIHIVSGNKQDNFWMMGETGPCGPCSELHFDLTPSGDTRGVLVNRGTAECIEVWNLVFIQFNANPDGTFTPLPARHVDTGMGFERVCSIIQGTKYFHDFTHARVSNYETDLFQPFFAEIERLSGQSYTSTLPEVGRTDHTPQEQVDIAFRVIADHIRTLSCAIADGILPGNSDRHYVLRRILRRAVRYGRTLGLHKPFFFELVDVVVNTLGDVFPELVRQRTHIREVLQREEEAFNRTLDKGIEIFNRHLAQAVIAHCAPKASPESIATQVAAIGSTEWEAVTTWASRQTPGWSPASLPPIRGEVAFRLYDEQGFPLDLTQLMARERGLLIDLEGFEQLMAAQKAQARAAQKRSVIELSQLGDLPPTRFLGFDSDTTEATVQEILEVDGSTVVVLDQTVAYAAMGGQIGDTGTLSDGGSLWAVADTRKSGQTWLHFLDTEEAPEPGETLTLRLDTERRRRIERHHTVTHLLHWALHEIVGGEVSQKGSHVGADKLTFDFNAPPLSPAQLAEIERLVNRRILENRPVTWIEIPYETVRVRPDIMQFFGDKYGERVRVVQIGGEPGALDGYSMELCGGTHSRATGELGLFRITAESAIAAGIRRIEAVAGLESYDRALLDHHRLQTVAKQLNCPVNELEHKVESLLLHQKELEKTLKAMRQREAVGRATALLAEATRRGSASAIVADLGELDGDALQAVVDELKSRFDGIICLVGRQNGGVALAAAASSAAAKICPVGKLIQQIAPLVDGKGGGRPEQARGAGKAPVGIPAALQKARTIIAEAGT